LARNRYKPGKIVSMLRQAEVLHRQDMPMVHADRGPSCLPSHPVVPCATFQRPPPVSVRVSVVDRGYAGWLTKYAWYARSPDAPAAGEVPNRADQRAARPSDRVRRGDAAGEGRHPPGRARSPREDLPASAGDGDRHVARAVGAGGPAGRGDPPSLNVWKGSKPTKEMRRGSADPIRASRHQVPHQKAGYKTAICLPVTPKSVLAPREASIQADMVRPHGNQGYRPPAPETIVVPSWPSGFAPFRRTASLAENSSMH